MFKKKQSINRYTEILVTSMLVVCHYIFNVTGFGKTKDDVIYILLWSAKMDTQFEHMELGHVLRQCDFRNCFFIDDYSYFGSITDFDVIIIDMLNLSVMSMDNLPSPRSEKQKYVMFGLEPAGKFRIPSKFDRYFNLTFTYKLTSNIPIPYVIVKDINNTIIGPNINMQWMKLSEMNEPSDFVKSKLQSKRVAAAWMISNCYRGYRSSYVDILKSELRRYGQRLHVYGDCGTFFCPKGERVDECYAKIESNYYFYLAFENSFGEDYVTEKVLNALEHFTVPVILGGANYSRYMPEGIYLDANVLEPKDLAKRMNEIIKDKNEYYEFFRWHDHYSFHSSSEDLYHDICLLCDYLNNNLNQTSTIENISLWWNESSGSSPKNYAKKLT